MSGGFICWVFLHNHVAVDEHEKMRGQSTENEASTNAGTDITLHSVDLFNQQEKISVTAPLHVQNMNST